MQLRRPGWPHKIRMRHTALLLSLVLALAIPLCAPAQEVQPCYYGLPCLSPGGSPDLVSPNQLARIIQGRTDETEIQQVQQMQRIDVHPCDGLAGNSRLACTYINIHGCRRPTSAEWYAARLDAETLRLVAAACRWQ